VGNEARCNGNAFTMTDGKDQSFERCVSYAEFSLGGLLRFLSHQELLALWRRTSARADLPVAFSRGYNPRAKVSLPVPRSVGMSCLGDLVRLELNERVAEDTLKDQLQTHLPAEIRIDRAWITESKAFPQARVVEWEIDLAGWDLAGLDEKIRSFLGAGRFLVRRRSKKTGKEKEINVRPFVLGLGVGNDVLWARVSAGPEGSIRPTELVEALGHGEEQVLPSVTRTKIHWHDVNSWRLS